MLNIVASNRKEFEIDEATSIASAKISGIPVIKGKDLYISLFGDNIPFSADLAIKKVENWVAENNCFMVIDKITPQQLEEAKKKGNRVILVLDPKGKFGYF